MFAQLGSMVRDLSAKSGVGLWTTLAVALAASVFESAGILLIIPFLELHSATSAAGGSSLFTPLLNWLGATTTNSRIFTVLACLLIIACLRAALVWQRDMRLAAVTFDYAFQWREILARHIAFADWKHVVQTSRHGLQHTLVEDSLRLELAAYSVAQSAISAVLVIVQICIALWLSPTLTVIALAALVFVVMVLRPMFGAANQMGAETIDVNRDVFGMTTDLVLGLKQARVLGQQQAYLDLFKTGMMRQRELAMRHARQDVWFSQIFSVAIVLIICAMLVIGLIWLDLSVPILIAVILLLVRISYPTQSILMQARVFAEMAPAIDNLHQRLRDLPIIKAPVVRNARTAKDAPFILAQTLQIETSSGQLAPINFSADRGSIISLSGPSGIGKTTLLDVMSGLIEPADGSFSIGGDHPVTAFQSKKLRLLYLVQDSALPEMTIRKSLTWGLNERVTDDELWAALDQVEMKPRVELAPQGLETVLSQGGAMFSGGERQRLNMARVWLHQPDVLFLDEATSALDSEMEKRLLAKLSDLPTRPTICIVNHRPNVANWADVNVKLTAQK